MVSRCASFALLLCAVLLVTTSFAANKKSELHRSLRAEWSDTALQNGTLPELGSSVSGDWNLTQLPSGGSGAPFILNPGVPDKWNGGDGKWSVAPNWNNGVPGPNSDVTIYSGGYDTVNLDVNRTINSLTLGGASNGTQSILWDFGAPRTLIITNSLNVGKTGVLHLSGGSTVMDGADSFNLGKIITNVSGNVITITGKLTNSGSFLLQGTEDVATIGSLTNSGTFQLNGPNDVATIGSLTNNPGGSVDLERGSTLRIVGDVTNRDDIITNNFGFGGNNTLTIAGMLTNNGRFELLGPNDVATIGSLTNNPGGSVDLERGSKLTIIGDVTNRSQLDTGRKALGGGNTIIISGTLTNDAGFFLLGPGDAGFIGNGLSNNFDFEILNHSTMTIYGGALNRLDILLGNVGTLQIVGDVINNRIIADGLIPGGNTLTITGNVINNGDILLREPGDAGSIGNGLSNTGRFEVFNQSTMTVSAAIANSGTVDVENVSTLNIAGNVINSGTFATDMNDLGGGNTVNITGDLTNNKAFGLLGPGDQVTIFGSTTNKGLFGLIGVRSKAAMGSLTNTGQVQVVNGSTLQVNGGFNNLGTLLTGIFGGGSNTVNVLGMVTNQDTGKIGLGGPGDTMNIGRDLDNSGTVGVGGGSTLNVGGSVTNSGIVLTNGGAGGMNTIAINGMFTNTATGTVTLNGPGDLLKALAGMSNRGVISVSNGSSVDPPFFNNLGTLNIDGTSRFVVGTPTPMGGQGYIQLANGTLGEMIAGLNSFGVINVKGSALLDGTLAILLQGGFNPSVGSTYKFLNFTPGMVSGIFANIQNDIFNGGTEKWVVDYNNVDGFVELIAEQNAPVSEPATLLVLLPGLLGAGYGLRHKLFQ